MDMSQDGQGADTVCSPKGGYPELEGCPLFYRNVFFGEKQTDGSYTVSIEYQGKEDGKPFVVISVDDSCGNEAHGLKLFWEAGAAASEKFSVPFSLGQQDLKAQAVEMGLEMDGHSRTFAHVDLRKADC
jgi:hypothetical protein